MCSFSERNNFRETSDIPITIRNEAPEGFRNWLISLALRLLIPIDRLRSLVSQVTCIGEDSNNWSPNEFMLNEVKENLKVTQWYYVYDVAEKLYSMMPVNNRNEYERELNRFFETNGYGWKCVGGTIQYRGNCIEEHTLSEVEEQLANNQTVQSELNKALADISKRPDADITGTIQHALAAIECFCKNKFNAPSHTLGQIINDNKTCFTPPLDQTLHTLWGFASEHGRHIQEGNEPTFEEAELTLNICASLILYISKTL